ncbi:DUF3397 domain-containing protein [Psychrobacillus sp. OK032]|uniref:DUF3397 domain-containing protein n=1 Tax=Psychrobacillus sp. OK032 TaxID=1884358 RepID=UPI0015A7290E|nr:DUF3397 domain-containing protein [Psychrobacillus sp. OK032]
MLLYPIVLFILTFIVSKYFFHKRKKSIGIAADVTTFLLFFSVSHVYTVIFVKNIGFLLIICSLVFASILTFLEWRTKHEIEVRSLLRKIWRILFMLLCLFYAFLWVFGVIRYVFSYIS